MVNNQKKNMTREKGELVMIYLNQGHDTTEKYPIHDEVLMPLVVFLNNRIDFQGKKRLLKNMDLRKQKERSKKCVIMQTI